MMHLAGASGLHVPLQLTVSYHESTCHQHVQHPFWLGAGGMTTVYLADDLKHHRKVAAKLLRPEPASGWRTRRSA